MAIVTWIIRSKNGIDNTFNLSLIVLIGARLIIEQAETWNTVEHCALQCPGLLQAKQDPGLV